MNIAVLAARLLLALVFVVAGAAKLADRKGSSRALIAFGSPVALAGTLGVVLPLAELAVAAALLPAATAPWGALGALALLLLFTIGIGFSLTLGKRPECCCFGRLRSAPAGWGTLVRNGVLVAFAGFVIWGSREGGVAPKAFGWDGSPQTLQLSGLTAVAVGLVAGFWWLSVKLRRRDGSAPSRRASRATEVSGGTCGDAHLDRPARRKVGEAAPEINIHDPHSGEAVDLWSIEGESTLVLFYDPDCAFCQRLLPELERWEESPPEGSPMLLVISTVAMNTGLGSPTLVDHSRTIFREFGAGETPSALLVDGEGKVASEVAVGALEILELAGSRRSERSVSR